MIQVRLGIAGAVLAFGAHTTHVYRERQKVPTGRLLQFSPGSQDDIISDSLRTGDLVLFSRDCVLYPCLQASVCAARKELSGKPFDHAGVVVILRGVPHIVEHTAGGVRCRRYDARIKASRAREIVVRPLGLALSPAQHSSLDSFLSLHGVHGVQEGEGPVRRLGQMLSPRAGAAHALDLALLVLDGRRNPSLDLVSQLYSALGLGQGKGSDSPMSPVPVSMDEVANWHADPWRPDRFKKPIWVRDLR